MSSKYLTRIFVVEDDLTFGKALQLRLEKEQDFEVHSFTKGQDYLQSLHLNPDIVSMDYNLPDISGLELLKKTSEYNSQISCIVVSGQEDVEVVVQAYRGGAKDYIVKKENAIIELINSIKNLSVNTNLRKEVEDLRAQIIDRQRYEKIIGESKPVLNILRLLQKVEKTNMMVLITGESGTGKEVIANTIHYNSPRCKEAFVPVNMAAIPPDLIESELFGHEKGAFTGANGKRIGKFEEANHGTIFLDEIGEMDINMQTKLLRVLQESSICRVGSNKQIQLNVRVVAATNRNLGQMVKDGKFREDLFYRLQGFLLHLSPLNERGNDILLLAKHFLQKFCSGNNIGLKTFDKPSLEALLDYSWPGNVRELKSVVERAVIISDNNTITEDDLIFSQVVF